jgi:hypothetical protein
MLTQIGSVIVSTVSPLKIYCIPFETVIFNTETNDAKVLMVYDTEEIAVKGHEEYARMTEGELKDLFDEKQKED